MVMSQMLHMAAEQDKHHESETWRCSGVDDVSARDHLLGLLQLSHASVMSSPKILHVSHHELDRPTHASLL